MRKPALAGLALIGGAVGLEIAFDELGAQPPRDLMAAVRGPGAHSPEDALPPVPSAKPEPPRDTKPSAGPADASAAEARHAADAESTSAEALSTAAVDATLRAGYVSTWIDDSRQLEEFYSAMGYRLEPVRSREATVPRIYLGRLPGDLVDLTDVDRRKRLFVRTMLPLVLRVNAAILRERAFLHDMIRKDDQGEAPTAGEQRRLEILAEHFGTGPDDLDQLLMGVDVIPPSLAIAQSAIESGWGTSRFAQEGNALFGQWTFGESGLVPEAAAEGSSHRVRAFEKLIDSVSAYAFNLNTHRAYAEFRERRAALRRSGRVLLGADLAPTLRRYSERGDDYVRDLRVIQQENRLAAFDRAQLSPADDWTLIGALLAGNRPGGV